MASADAPRQRIGALAQSDILCQTYGVLVPRVLHTRNQVYRPDNAYGLYPRVLYQTCIILKSCQTASLWVCVNKDAVAIGPGSWLLSCVDLSYRACTYLSCSLCRITGLA